MELGIDICRGQYLLFNITYLFNICVWKRKVKDEQKSVLVSSEGYALEEVKELREMNSIKSSK